MAKKVFKHKSFKRSYREDYRRELEVPGVATHLWRALKILCKNAKLFLLLWGVMAIAGAVVIVSATTEVAEVLSVLLFLVMWLTTIFLLRHIMAGHKVTLRDGLYNAMTPLASTIVIFGVIIIQCVPIFALIIAYASAVETNFLAMPFYALLFWGFAGLMILLAGYLLSSSLMALVAVSAPGLYPWQALTTAGELMAGRRVRFILRVVALLIFLAIQWGVVVLPLALWLKTNPAVSVAVVTMAAWSAMYAATYLYMYYRWMLNYDEK